MKNEIIYQARNYGLQFKIMSIIGIVLTVVGFILRKIADSFTVMTSGGSGGPMVINGITYHTSSSVVSKPTSNYYLCKNIGLILIILGILVFVGCIILSRIAKQSKLEIYEDRLYLSNKKGDRNIKYENIKMVSKKNMDSIIIVTDNEKIEIPTLLDVDIVVENVKEAIQQFNKKHK